MAKYSLQWRCGQAISDGLSFVHRIAYATSGRAVKDTAAAICDLAWKQEFLVSRGGKEVFTNLHQIARWMPDMADLPQPAPHHLWLHDLKRKLIADQFLDTIGKCVVPAVDADVLSSADARALVRFARTSLRRPRL